MKIAVVGSRTFPLLDNVKWFVNELPEGIILFSGGADGVDTAVAQAARTVYAQKMDSSTSFVGFVRFSSWRRWRTCH